jgi:hypothetical protein
MGYVMGKKLSLGDVKGIEVLGNSIVHLKEK